MSEKLKIQRSFRPWGQNQQRLELEREKLGIQREGMMMKAAVEPELQKLLDAFERHCVALLARRPS